MSRPNPSLAPAPAGISVSYERDVDGAAEALLAILRHQPRFDESQSHDPGGVSEDAEK